MDYYKKYKFLNQILTKNIDIIIENLVYDMPNIKVTRFYNTPVFRINNNNVNLSVSQLFLIESKLNEIYNCLLIEFPFNSEELNSYELVILNEDDVYYYAQSCISPNIFSYSELKYEIEKLLS